MDGRLVGRLHKKIRLNFTDLFIYFDKNKSLFTRRLITSICFNKLSYFYYNLTLAGYVYPRISLKMLYLNNCACLVGYEKKNEYK